MNCRKLNYNRAFLLVFIVGLYFVFIIYPLLIQDFNSTNKPNSFEHDLKTAKISKPFKIDGNQGWVDLKNAGNCTGEGTYIDPYVIEDLIIDGEGTGWINEIYYSTVYFIIRNCTIYNGGSGIYCYNITNGKFIDNNITNCYQSGIRFNFYCKNNTITRNSLENNNEGIYLTSTYGQNKIFNNNISNNWYRGIALSYSNGNEVSDNFISNNGDGSASDESGITLHGTLNNVVSNNTIFHTNHGSGLYLAGGSRSNQILINKIHNNKDGIKIYYSSLLNTYNLIKGNIVANNSDRGILIYYTMENNITQNIIKHNYFGIDASSRNNTIYNNTFISNHNQAGDGVNFWNNSEIGNYWDDYGGKDFNDDGIGDTPRFIPGPYANSFDYLPIWYDGPTINITTPENHTIFTSNFKPPTYSLSILDPNLDEIWYTINLGAKKYLTEANDTIDYDSWINLMNGNITLRFYANDTFGNINFNQLIVIKETQPPNLLVFEPNEGTIYGSDPPSFNLTISDLPFNFTWYTLDNGLTNYTTFNIFSNNTYGVLNQSVWTSLPDSLITVKFYGKDIIGRICFNEVNIYKDVAIPVININSPILNSSYGESAPQFDLTIIEGNLISTWYSINGGSIVNISSFTGTINQAIWESLSDGQVIITFYAKDIANNIAFQSITVIKDTPPPEPTPTPSPEIQGYNLVVLIGVSLVIILIQTRKKLKK